MTDTPTPCINCGEPVATPYCAQCGQNNPAKKINLVTLYTDFQSRIYGFDGKFPRTLRDLTTKPGKVAMDFVHGNRVKYVGPVGYFFLTITIFVLLISWLEIDFYAFAQVNNPMRIEPDKGAEEVSKYFIGLIAKNMRIFSFILVPITGFFTWVFFRRQGYNVLENMVLAFYSAGHLEWISILNILLYSMFNWGFGLWQVVVNMIYYGFASTGFFPHHKKGKAFFKGIMVNIVSFLVFQILMIITVVVATLSSPELRQMFKSAL